MHNIKPMGVPHRNVATIFCSLFPGGHLQWTLEIKSFHRRIRFNLLHYQVVTMVLMARSRHMQKADTLIRQDESTRGHLSLRMAHLMHFAMMELNVRPFLRLWHLREVDRRQTQAMERLVGRPTRGAVELLQQLVLMKNHSLMFNRSVRPMDRLRH